MRPPFHPRLSRRFATLATAALLPAAVAASVPAGAAADAGCSGETLSQPFSPWADPASYTLAPGGSFEAGAPAWSLAGGASVVAGNEPFTVGSPADSASLHIPAGGSAATPAVCVDAAHPTVRFFARNSGDASAPLDVQVTYANGLGLPQTSTIGKVLGSGTWAPSPQVAILVNVLAASSGSGTVSFTLVPEGAGDWQVDDFYVDPYSRS